MVHIGKTDFETQHGEMIMVNRLCSAACWRRIDLGHTGRRTISSNAIERMTKIEILCKKARLHAI